MQLDRWIAGVLAVSLVSARATGAGEPTAAGSDPAATYALKCAACHGERRYGGYAPP